MKTLEATLVDETHLELSEPLDGPVGRRLAISVEDERTTPTPQGQAVRGRHLREREDAWCRANMDVLRRYVGQWVVVEGEEVLVHGNDPARVVEKARRLGVRSPYLFRVDDTPSDVLQMGGL